MLHNVNRNVSTKSGRNGEHIWRRKNRFHNDNAPSHTSNTAQAKKHELGFESFPHPPYYPDLTRSSYYYMYVPKPQEMAVWSAFWVERRSWMGNRRVFWRVWQIVLFGSHRKVERSFDSSYRAKRGIHWKIKPTFAKKKKILVYFITSISNTLNTIMSTSSI